jgi:TRAP-type C4-dicarboxylate transport system permease small subunit
MKRLLDQIDRIVLFLLVIVLTVMVVVGTMQVVWRYLLTSSLSWSEELMRFLYVWATMLGLCCGIRRQSFAKIDNLLDYVEAHSKVGGKIFHVLCFSLEIFVLCLLIYYGYLFAMRGRMQTSPAMGIKMIYVYIAFPIGGLLGLAFTIEEIMNYFRKA